MFLPLFCIYLETSNGLIPTAGELMMLNRWLIVPGVEHAMLNIGFNLCWPVQGPRGSMVPQGSHNERSRNTLKHSTCSHNWWETLKGSIFGVKPSNPALRGPGGGLVVAPAENASLLGLSFTARSFMSSLSLLCFVSLSIGEILCPSKLLSSWVCFSILIHLGVLILWVGLLYF